MKSGYINLDEIMIRENVFVINYYIICAALQNVIGYQHVGAFSWGHESYNFSLLV